MRTLTQKFKALYSLGVVALSACSGDDPDADAPAQIERCDPLAARELPTKLGTIIAAGEDTTGTIYVADRTSESRERVFVSRGNSLYRMRVEGSGSSGGTDFTWQFEHDGESERMVVQKQGDKVTGIALASPGQRTFFDQLDDTARRLMPVDASRLAGFAVRNLAGEVVVEFVADVENHSRIVVTRPEDDWTYEDFRVFYGTNGQLIERVTHFSGAKSYRAFDFVVDGATWRVIFGSNLNSAVESELDTGSESFHLTLVDPPVPSANDTFECLGSN